MENFIHELELQKCIYNAFPSLSCILLHLWEFMKSTNLPVLVLRISNCHSFGMYLIWGRRVCKQMLRADIEVVAIQR